MMDNFINSIFVLLIVVIVGISVVVSGFRLMNGQIINKDNTEIQSAVLDSSTSGAEKKITQPQEKTEQPQDPQEKIEMLEKEVAELKKDQEFEESINSAYRISFLLQQLSNLLAK